MKRLLKLAAPYIAVVIFWMLLENAWLAILAYHAQIILWSRRPLQAYRRPEGLKIIFAALPAAAAGPLLYFLLPVMTGTEISLWLARYHLTGLPLILMIPYFGILHPVLEQAHWSELRESTPAAHLLFAGYHMLVLHSLFTIRWLVAAFAILTAVSFIWQRMEKRSGTLLVPAASHVLANLGMIIAAWIRL